jgi:hypothetical protein
VEGFLLSVLLGWILVWSDGQLSWPLIPVVLTRGLETAFCALILGRLATRRRRLPEAF